MKTVRNIKRFSTRATFELMRGSNYRELAVSEYNMSVKLMLLTSSSHKRAKIIQFYYSS